MAEKTLTAAKAIIKVDGVAIGTMRNIRCTENIRRGEVQGIGNLTMQELPATAITCTWSCGFYAINLKRDGIPGLDPRNAQSVKDYSNTIMLRQKPVDIYIYKKDIETIDGKMIVTEIKEQEYAIIRDLHLESTSFNVNEGQIAGMEQSGRYLDPIISPE